jgi:hypothetical protein
LVVSKFELTKHESYLKIALFAVAHKRNLHDLYSVAGPVSFSNTVVLKYIIHFVAFKVGKSAAVGVPPAALAPDDGSAAVLY